MRMDGKGLASGAGLESPVELQICGQTLERRVELLHQTCRRILRFLGLLERIMMSVN
jgi:hypothetical protein